MNEIRADKDELLRLLKQNRQRHYETFLDAEEAWKETVKTALHTAAEMASAGLEFKTRFDLPKPENHTQEYDDVIGMLEMHTRDEIELDTYQYRQFVKDEWTWKPQFAATSSRYLG